MLHLRSRGRGRAYSRLRGGVESALRVAYTGGWPAALWGMLPRACEVETTVREVPMLPPDMTPVRIGFVSDLHLGPTTPRRLLGAAFAQLAAARLDVLLLGGDYVFLDTTTKKERELAALVASVPARVKLAVLGNHDLWTAHAGLERALERGGAELLTNRSVRVGGAHERLAIAGLDEPWTGAPDAAAALRDVQGADALVLLCHSPDGLPAIETALARMPDRPDTLFVCGHTHGGHVATPWGPLVVPGPMGRRYPQGLFRVGGIRLFVSRGVGGIEVPIRTFARPEIVIFDLVPRLGSKTQIGA